MKLSDRSVLHRSQECPKAIFPLYWAQISGMTRGQFNKKSYMWGLRGFPSQKEWGGARVGMMHCDEDDLSEPIIRLFVFFFKDRLK